jgi:hypothetical protein
MMTDDIAGEMLDALYASANTLNDRTQVREFMRYVLECTSSGDVTVLNDILTTADPSKLSHRSIGAVLRVTSSLRNNLPSWYLCRDKCKALLESQGEDSARLLVGMLHNNPYQGNYGNFDVVILQRHPSLK